MPFTFSHPSVVLPLNYLPRRWVSLTALVIGSMTPDFEYFLRMRVSSQYSHSMKGLLWFDLPLAIMLMLVYNYLIKDKLIDNLPKHFNKRFSGFKNSHNLKSKSHVAAILVCLLIGAASHIFWDGFTHPTGYFVMHIHYLRYKILIAHYPVQVFNILQHLSSIAGALIILFAINKLPVGKITCNGNVVYYWIKIFAVALLILIERMLTGLNLHQYGDIIVTAISGVLIGLVIISASTPAKQMALPI